MLKYLRSQILPSKPAQLLIQSGLKWNRDDCSGMAAALSYFALFSLFPMLLVILSIVGWIVGPGTVAFAQILQAIELNVPVEVRELVKSTLVALHQNSAGAGVIGFGFLLWTGSAVFTILRNSVNQIWKLPPTNQNRLPNQDAETRSVPQMVLPMLANRLFAFLLVLGTALLLLSALVTNIAIGAILRLVATFQETLSFIHVDELELTYGLQSGSSCLILALTTCILFKMLPSVYVGWRDVWLAALLTTALLLGLQELASNSVISVGSQFISYGVIGSVMILLLWIFLTFQIFLFGCVFSYVYAHLFGSRRHHALPPDSRLAP